MYNWVRLGHLVQWSGATVSDATPLGLMVTSISTDSRTIRPGEVFLALKGPDFDGHDYVDQAIKGGAIALITEKSFRTQIPLLTVDNSMTALVHIARRIRDYFEGTVIAVTGSAGKSSTKNMIATCLGEDVVSSPASFNNLIGVSKTVLLLQDLTRYLVLEIGMNALGEIQDLCHHFRPHVGVLTNIGDAHIGKLGGQEEIYKAKKELFDFLSFAGTTGISVNVGDPRVLDAYREAFSTKKVPVVTYSLDKTDADVFVEQKKVDPNTGYLSVTLSIMNEKNQFEFPIFGIHHAQNIVAAAATALCAGINVKTVIKRLPLVGPAPHRGEISEFSKGVTLIDESYNSNPTALLSSLTSLALLSPSRRKILVIGDMLELGQFSEQLHKEMGEKLRTILLGHRLELIGVGNHTKELIDTAGFGAVVPSEQAALQFIIPMIQPKDIIFIKGSRGVKLDRLVQHLIGPLALGETSSIKTS